MTASPTNCNLTPLAPKLGKLLLLLSSNRDGEVIAAARAIDKVLRGAGCDWHDLITTVLPPATQSGSYPRSERSAIEWCFYHLHLLSSRDAHFIKGLKQQWTSLTDKQRAWLRDIVVRLERVEAA
jgi:hypothetical protein